MISPLPLEVWYSPSGSISGTGSSPATTQAVRARDSDGAIAFGAIADGNVSALLPLLGDVMFRRNGTDQRS